MSPLLELYSLYEISLTCVLVQLLGHGGMFFVFDMFGTVQPEAEIKINNYKLLMHLSP